MEFLDPDLQRTAPGASWIDRCDLSVALTDPNGNDEELGEVNAAFTTLTGYDAAECIGRNCRMLQGAGTEPGMVARVRAGIDKRQCRLTVLRNYRRDGEAFDNAVLIGPLPESNAAPARLFGLQWNLEATAKRRMTASEGDWATANVEKRIATVEAMATYLVARSLENDDDAARLLGRLVAATRPQQYPLDDKRPNWTRGDALVSYLLYPYECWLGLSTTISSDIGVLAADAAPLIAIALHECARIARAMAPAQGGTPDVHVRLDDCLFDRTAAMRLTWRAQWSNPTVVARIDGVVQDTLLEDAFALVEHLALLAGGRFELTTERYRFVAELTVLNRPTA